jgi:hypothetical protein
MRPISVVVPFLVAAALSSPDVRAQSGGSAEAEELFKQGRAALDAKDYVTACARLRSSLELERAVGTLISLAQCEEASTQLAGARQHWQEAADLADATNDRLHRGPFARQRFAAIDPRVPRLVIRLAASAPKTTTFRRDAVATPFRVFDTALPLDPGAHTITAVSPGHDDRVYRFDLAEAEHHELEIEPGPETAIEAPPPAPVAPLAPVASSALVAPESPPSDGSGRRTASYVLGGVGVVGLGLGAFFGVTTFSKWSSAKSDCGGGCAAGSNARSEASAASTAGTVSTVAFTAGGVALAAAAFLFFTAPTARTGLLVVTPTVGTTGGGIDLRGAF